ncbi:MAG: VOC family protein [Armatimonadota bacterium]|nr:VOC family protein [Armatimonadota bacterium]MDR7533377.1 VOC family protein [Armatimonadota bacterium]MDR7536497.1 VOC family protein [Armatimonadota bacterium]
MQLHGIHHITAITADARRNLDFYTRVLGLRLVKKSVNQDDPTAYHLFYSDEQGRPGADLTFFEYPGIERGTPGAGMVHRITWRVASDDALAFWERRLVREGVQVRREDGQVRFADPEGLEHALAIDATGDEPLVAVHPEIPAEVALRGFAGVQAYAAAPDASRRFLEEGLGFVPRPATELPDAWFEVRGALRGAFYACERSARPGASGAGTVHHVAWCSTDEEHDAWRRRVRQAGGAPTPIIDRYYFRSIYFREPGGVLFEIATLGPGFAADEPPEHLGERLSLPPQYEALRPALERLLTPLPNPRDAWPRGVTRVVS